MRIHITGNAGSGKSTLAETIGTILGLDVFSLDEVVWKEGWEITPQGERRRREEVIVARPQWVIEGVSSIARQAADTIIFLDFPRSVCYLRCAKRNWRYLFRSRPGLPDNCPEIKIVPALFSIIWKFPSTAKPKIVNDIEALGKTGVRLKCNEEVVKYIKEVEHNKNLQRICKPFG